MLIAGFDKIIFPNYVGVIDKMREKEAVLAPVSIPDLKRSSFC